MIREEWREVPGFPGYMASSFGRIRSHRSEQAGRILAVGDHRGYPWVCITRADGRRVGHGVHFFVCLAFNGPRPEGMEVRHLDGSKDNNVPSNLRWGTHAENMQDRTLHGTAPDALRRGECINGHPWTDESTHFGPQGYPRCRICDREQVAARRLRRRLDLARAAA